MAERQVPAAADNDHSNQARSLAAAMGASLRRYWEERTSYQSFLYAAGVLLLASGLVHTLVFLVDGAGGTARCRGASRSCSASRSGSRC